MASRIISPERILPTRMTLQIPADSSAHFSVLEFPWDSALKAFTERFEESYHQKAGKSLPYHLKLPFRQLNDGLLTAAPGLIQAFEPVKQGEQSKRRMVAFTRYHGNGHGEIPEDFPSEEQLRSLIRHWLERWGAQVEINPILKGDGNAAWKTLMKAVDAAPETDWQHGITPASLSADLNSAGGLGYIALPALLTATLHMKEMTIHSEKGTHYIEWRRVNQGGKNGLHLVSQPIPFQDDYFAYRLDFSVQTQAGYVDAQGKPCFWIFAHLSIQRYITERYRPKNDGRNISILVGYNRERFAGRWDEDTTLIRLDMAKNRWDSGVGELLNDFSIRKLLAPDEILSNPFKYGNYGADARPVDDEYYVVYAEGRKFGDERERGHQVKTGTSLRERSQIMAGVLSLLAGWLEVSPPFKRNIQNTKNTLALRDYNYMMEERKDNSKQQASWRNALQTSLSNSRHTHLHLVVLHRSPMFQEWAQKQIDETLMGLNKEANLPVTVTFSTLPLSLYLPLDSGELDPQIYFRPAREKPPGFNEKWNARMRESYGKKREEWRAFLQGIAWKPNARRLVLIDSTGESGLPHNQKIKGAVRDACVHEKSLPQFIIGNLKLDTHAKSAGKLDGNSAGRLQNAVLDLVLRQQGILYAPPREIYELAAKMDTETAAQLDIIAFCRVKRQISDVNYVLAVRLCMNHETPQYVTADDWASEEVMRDLEHLTGYVDPCVSSPLHYMSIARLSEGQKDQRGKQVRETFKADPGGKYDKIAFKHAQIVELVPFFVHPRFQHDDGQRQLCRCIHFLRISPGFTMGEIVLPYPMHLGETLINDMLCIVGADE